MKWDYFPLTTITSDRLWLLTLQRGGPLSQLTPPDCGCWQGYILGTGQHRLQQLHLGPSPHDWCKYIDIQIEWMVPRRLQVTHIKLCDILYWTSVIHNISISCSCELQVMILRLYSKFTVCLRLQQVRYILNLTNIHYMGISHSRCHAGMRYETTPNQTCDTNVQFLIGWLWCRDKKLRHRSIIVGCWDIHWNMYLLFKQKHTSVSNWPSWEWLGPVMFMSQQGSHC